MPDITIKIPDNLTSLEEAALIAKKLTQKALSGSARGSKNRIGTEIKIIEQKTNIVIERVNKEKPIETLKCNVCGCTYQSNMAKIYFTNYGGKIRSIKVCSSQCIEDVITMFPDGRVAKSRSKLKPLRVFN